MTPVKQYELIDAFNNYLLVIIADLGIIILGESSIVTLVKVFLPTSNLLSQPLPHVAFSSHFSTKGKTKVLKVATPYAREASCAMKSSLFHMSAQKRKRNEISMVATHQ